MTFRRRHAIRRKLVLALAIAAVAAPAAQAYPPGGMLDERGIIASGPDQSQTALELRSQALNDMYLAPDALDRYLRNNPDGVSGPHAGTAGGPLPITGLVPVPGAPALIAPEPTAQPRPLPTVAGPGGMPTVEPTPVAPGPRSRPLTGPGPQPVTATGTDDGFGWGDAGIGLAVGAAAALLAGALALGFRNRGKLAASH